MDHRVKPRGDEVFLHWQNSGADRVARTICFASPSPGGGRWVSRCSTHPTNLVCSMDKRPIRKLAPFVLIGLLALAPLARGEERADTGIGRAPAGNGENG